MSEKYTATEESPPSLEDPNDIMTLPRAISPDAVTARNTFLEELLNDDPNRPLPAITLHERTGKPLEIPFEGHEMRTGHPKVASTIFDIMSPEGERVGHAVLNQPTEAYMGSTKWFIGNVEAEPHKGYGPAVYLAILKALPEGKGLRTEGVLSPEAVLTWEKMVAKGIARPSDKGGTPTAFETSF